MSYNQPQQLNKNIPKFNWDLKHLEKLAAKVKENEEELIREESKKCHH